MKVPEVLFDDPAASRYERDSCVIALALPSATNHRVERATKPPKKQQFTRVTRAGLWCASLELWEKATTVSLESFFKLLNPLKFDIEPRRTDRRGV